MSAPPPLCKRATDPAPFQQAMAQATRLILDHYLAIHAGNRARTAAALGIERTYLQRLIRFYCPTHYGTGRRGRPTQEAQA